VRQVRVAEQQREWGEAFEMLTPLVVAAFAAHGGSAAKTLPSHTT